MHDSDEPDGIDEYEDFRVFSPEDEDEDLDDTPSAASDKPTVEEVIANLVKGERRYADLIGLSDLTADDLALLSSSWETVAPDLRALVVQEAADIASDNIFLEFTRFFLFASRDPEPAVRQQAVKALGQPLGEDVEPRLIEILESDPSEDVRIEAASSIGPWAEYAELDDDDPDLRDRIAGLLFGIAEDPSESWHVRRRAAESAAIFGPSERVNRLIRMMYDEDEIGLRASAIFAAGRGNQREWLPAILEELRNDDAELRFEAARAAGLFGDVDALPALSELAKDDDDVDVRHTAIAAIGEIGGKGAIRILRRLVDLAPDSDQDVIDDALIEASLDADPFGRFDSTDG